MRAVGLGVRLLLFAWAAFSALLALGIWRWMRERYGRVGPFPASQALALLNPQRARLHPVAQTLRAFRLKPGDTVLELGPGPGYFSIEAARTVGTGGRLVCLDVQPGMIATLRRRLDEHDAANAHVLVGDATKLPLAAHGIDAAFLVFVLGEIPDRPQALAELRRVMKPGGVLSIMETLTDPDYMLEASVRDLCRAYGFTELELKRQRLGYILVFAAPP
jgi:SAM-dependent methyltransferase